MGVAAGDVAVDEEEMLDESRPLDDWSVECASAVSDSVECECDANAEDDEDDDEAEAA